MLIFEGKRKSAKHPGLQGHVIKQVLQLIMDQLPWWGIHPNISQQIVPSWSNSVLSCPQAKGAGQIKGVKRDHRHMGIAKVGACGEDVDNGVLREAQGRVGVIVVHYLSHLVRCAVNPQVPVRFEVCHGPNVQLHPCLSA